MDRMRAFFNTRFFSHFYGSSVVPHVIQIFLGGSEQHFIVMFTWRVTATYKVIGSHSIETETTYVYTLENRNFPTSCVPIL